MLRQLPEFAREPLVSAKLDTRLKHSRLLLGRNPFGLQLPKGTRERTGGQCKLRTAKSDVRDAVAEAWLIATL